MKIEIAENMLYSWLRHCKCCQIVQTNFKASSFWPKNNEQEMEALFNLFQADERFSNFRYTGYRGRLQTFDSLMKDTECDLLALAFDEGNSYKLFAVESAFHENGLNYNDTQKKVIQKFFRNYLMARTFFTSDSIELIFVSPKIGETMLERLNPYIQQLRDFLAEQRQQVTIKLIEGDEFNTAIVEPLSHAISSIADESELFVRAIKLWRLNEHNVERRNAGAHRPAANRAQAPVVQAANELRAGYIVQTRLFELLRSGRLSQEEIANLQDASYCHRNFGRLRYPVLKSTEQGRFDDYGRARYYSEEFVIGQVHYYVTNDWYDRNKDALVAYLVAHDA